MRLGKEQAAGYVEDTGADALPVQEVTAGQADETALTPATEPALSVS
jgi:hypothetical protein